MKFYIIKWEISGLNRFLRLRTEFYCIESKQTKFSHHIGPFHSVSLTWPMKDFGSDRFCSLKKLDLNGKNGKKINVAVTYDQLQGLSHAS